MVWYMPTLSSYTIHFNNIRQGTYVGFVCVGLAIWMVVPCSPFYLPPKRPLMAYASTSPPPRALNPHYLGNRYRFSGLATWRERPSRKDKRGYQNIKLYIWSLNALSSIAKQMFYMSSIPSDQSVLTTLRFFHKMDSHLRK